MDTKTRAEKIIGLMGISEDFYEREKYIDRITSQLDESVREARESLKAEMMPKTEVYQEGFAAAKEKAAGIAESRPTGSADDGLVVQSDIVANIRAMQSAGKE